ncbi:MAG TPA: hypothetical protein PKY13_04030 [Microthrixaceae bacterium]|nr:hypothetical protein [Microthrixaceae bacterium]
MGTPFDSTIVPTKAGQRVAFLGHGGDVRQWMCDMTATVVRFNRNGHPVLALDPTASLRAQTGRDSFEVTDRWGCARLLDENDRRWARPA